MLEKTIADFASEKLAVEGYTDKRVRELNEYRAYLIDTIDKSIALKDIHLAAKEKAEIENQKANTELAETQTKHEALKKEHADFIASKTIEVQTIGETVDYKNSLVESINKQIATLLLEKEGIMDSIQGLRLEESSLRRKVEGAQTEIKEVELKKQSLEEENASLSDKISADKQTSSRLQNDIAILEARKKTL